MDKLGSAIRMASVAHEGQFDKGGSPYILHPIAVLYKVMQYTSDQDILCAAILHDVVEDTSVSLSQIEAEFGPIVRDYVDILSKQTGQSNEEYLTRVKKFYATTLIKLCDIEHNSDIRRLKGLRPKDFERMQKYHTTYIQLKQSIEEFN